MLSLRLTGLFVLAASAQVLAGCGPSLARVDPREVVNVTVRPASGQLLYCPGDAFQVELVAKLKDGSSCSNVDASRGCMGKKDTVIDAGLVHISGSSGSPSGAANQFVWRPDPDPLATADTGMTLKGWLEEATSGQPVKSMEGESQLKPVYDCTKERVFSYRPTGQPGARGQKGPDLTISITTLSTPFYPDAALIRVDWDAQRAYIISPSADRPVRIISQGQPGMPGAPGADGANGADGKDAEVACGQGGDGGDGQRGQPGGKGGDGGPGGVIKVIVDEANADKLKGRLLLASLGGDGAPGGRGGFGGAGGMPGAGGELNNSPDCKPKMGAHGKNGQGGPEGATGKPGSDGPAPTFENAVTQTLFANEINIIQRIESAKPPAK
jgi:hypothetical protein